MEEKALEKKYAEEKNIGLRNLGQEALEGKNLELWDLGQEALEGKNLELWDLGQEALEGKNLELWDLEHVAPRENVMQLEHEELEQEGTAETSSTGHRELEQTAMAEGILGLENWDQEQESWLERFLANKLAGKLKMVHIGKIFLWGILSLLAMIALYPVFFLISGSVMGKDELGSYLGAVISGSQGYAEFPLLPAYPTLRHYVEVFLDSPEFFVMFWNSVKITFGVLAGQLLVGTMAAWGFAKYDFPWKKGFFLIYMILMLLPFQVLMLSNYLVLDRLALTDNLWGIILPGMFSTFPVFIMYRFFVELPDSLLESARLDGAREWQLFCYIALPIGSSGIIAAMVLGFLEYWSLIEQPLTFLKEKSLFPLSIFLPDITSASQSGMAFAASVITFLPALLVFLGGQDYLEKGIMAGAVKE